MPGPGVPHTDLRPPRDCSLPAHPLSDEELQELVGLQIEKKWRIVVARDGRWFSRDSAGWWESQGSGDESAKR